MRIGFGNLFDYKNTFFQKKHSTTYFFKKARWEIWRRIKDTTIPVQIAECMAMHVVSSVVDILDALVAFIRGVYLDPRSIFQPNDVISVEISVKVLLFGRIRLFIVLITKSTNREIGMSEVTKWLAKHFATRDNAKTKNNRALIWSRENRHTDVEKWLVEHFVL